MPALPLRVRIFHSYYMGRIGHDIAGKAVMDDLHSNDVDTSLVHYSKDFGTGFSVLLLAPNGERTILTYRGASTHYTLHKSDFSGISADWLYLSSMEGNFEVLNMVWQYAKQHNIRIAFNPGKRELQQVDKLRDLLQQCTILSLNKEELHMIFHGDTLEDLVRDAVKTVPYVVGTDGPRGCVASDGKRLYRAGMYEDVPVIDRTGAGDAFSSGFTAMVARGEPMERALTFASANSTSVVGKIGAKAGILHAHARIHDMPIKVSDL